MTLLPLAHSWTICKRELLSLWVTPLAWVLLTAFLLVQGGVFYSILLHSSSLGTEAGEVGPLQAYFGQQSVLLSMTLLFVCPALTMRTFAEERRSGTIEVLLAAPLTSASLVLGKYAAVLVTYVLMWAPTLLYAVILRDTGNVEPRVLAISYGGILLVGAGYLAVGTLMSALSRSQLVALLLSVFLQFGAFILGIGEYVLDEGALRDVSAYVSLTTLLEETSRGLLDSRRLVLHLSITVWALYVTVRVVESWRESS
jgi:ABC-2 type transport system permease protein